MELGNQRRDTGRILEISAIKNHPAGTDLLEMDGILMLNLPPLEPEEKQLPYFLFQRHPADQFIDLIVSRKIRAAAEK